MKLRATFALVLLLSGASEARQQTPQSAELIPKDLVKLLLSSGMGAGFDVVLGVPPGFPEELLPEGARALIATTSTSMQSVIAEASDMPANLPRYERRVANAGWKAPAIAPYQPRGLMTTSTPPRMATILCLEDRQANYAMSPRPGGGSYVRVTVTTQPRPGPPCTQPSSSSGGYSGMQSEIDMPVLPLPAGARASFGTSSGGGMDSHEQRIRIETPMPAAEVLQHYREHVEKHGWVYVSQAVGEGMAFARFTLQSMKKEPVVGVIGVTQVPGARLEVSLYLARASTRGPY